MGIHRGDFQKLVGLGIEPGRLDIEEHDRVCPKGWDRGLVSCFVVGHLPTSTHGDSGRRDQSRRKVIERSNSHRRAQTLVE